MHFDVCLFGVENAWNEVFFFCFCERWVGWDEPQGGKGTQEDILLLQAVKIIHQLGERTLSVGYPAKHWLVMLMI